MIGKGIERTVEINADKIEKACEEMCRVFDDLGLTYEERGIVCKSGYKAAEAKRLDEETQNEIAEMLRKPTLEEKVMKLLPAITASAALILSLIALAIKAI